MSGVWGSHPWKQRYFNEGELKAKGYTVKGTLCNSPCGSNGKWHGKPWCYYGVNNNVWDYCCKVSDSNKQIPYSSDSPCQSNLIVQKDNSFDFVCIERGGTEFYTCPALCIISGQKDKLCVGSKQMQSRNTDID
ncbi:ORF20 [White sturgeon adenovirus 1]|uniref:ORF20 n=1 Tax=White sturgeon adenovirus 1 TaxID=2580388 RepID=A0A4P8PSA9_9ADEN|nr:ORF20 [White sturgeon adenovirus 1]QCQ84174.1 ORF20 [White sturgeon adenovirus 1]